MDRRKIKKNELNAKGIMVYLLFSIPYIIFMMYLYGMAQAYFPDPVEFAPGQFIDVSIGVILFGLITWSIISSIFLMYAYKKMKKQK